MVTTVAASGVGPVNDPWERRAGTEWRPLEGEVIEIDLVESTDDAAARGGGAAADTPPPNWRKVVALSSIAGLVLGVIVATVMIVGDDDQSPSPTTIPSDELASLITTPPTLPPIDELDDPDDPDGGLSGEQAVPIVSIPEFPATFAGDGSAPDPGSLAPPGTEISRRATIVSHDAIGGGAIQMRIAFDAASGRYELEVDLPVGTLRTIYDAASGSLFEQAPSANPVESWRRSDADTAFAGLSDALDITVDEYFEQLLLGPIRADNLDRAVSIATDDFTYEVAGFDTRRFIVTMPSGAAGIWQASGRTPEAITAYEVYVDGDGRILRTQGITTGDAGVEALQHVPAYPDEVPVELPDPDTVIDADATPDVDVDGTGPDDPAVDDGTGGTLRPTYDEPADLSQIDQDQFDVEVAFDHLFSRPPAASIVDVVWADGHQMFASQRDDVNDRRSMLVSSVASDDVTVQIDDGASATTLLTDDQRRNWTRLSNTGLGGRRLPVDERLISGPLTPGTVEAAEIQPGRFVALGDGTVAREVRLLVQPGDLALPSIVPMQLDAGEPVEVYVYVGAGVVHEIHVLSNVDAQIYIQVFDLRAEPQIALPDPSRIADG